MKTSPPSSLESHTERASRQFRKNIAGRVLCAYVALLAVLIAAGCGHPATEGGTSQTVASPPAMEVSAARAAVKPMRRYVTLLGTTIALDRITIRAPAAGRVSGFDLQSGDRVRRGQIVARIVTRNQEAAQAGVAIARKIDPTEAAALEKSVERHLSRTGVPVAAARNGIVVRPLVSPGQMVNEFDPLVALVAPDSIYVKAEAPIDELNAIKPGMNATVTSPLSPGRQYRARVAALSPSFSTGGTTSPVRVAFVGKDRITSADAAVEVRVATEYVPHAVAIPAAALFEDAASNNYYVFTVGGDDRAHRTVVRIGIRAPAEVQVTHGLKPGQVVVTSGGYALSDGLRVRATLTSR